ncbi:MAG: guanylate kinase [Lachnospiraceae bacterium]
MGRIFVIMGKSATGKDTIYKRLMEQKDCPLKKVVSYTTRPIRNGERNGVEYFFVGPEEFERYQNSEKLIELRTYHTVHGPWNYFTVDDGQIDLSGQDYLMISTLAGYEKLRAYYGEDAVVPIYIEAGDKERLLRYIAREEREKTPNYAEVCRRYLADEADFAKEELERLQIKKRYLNHDLEQCLAEIKQDMGALLERGQPHGHQG